MGRHYLVPLVSLERKSEFLQLITTLFMADTTISFNATLRIIRIEFTNVQGWLKWWVRAEHSELLFPIMKQSSSLMYDILFKSFTLKIPEFLCVDPYYNL